MFHGFYQSFKRISIPKAKNHCYWLERTVRILSGISLGFRKVPLVAVWKEAGWERFGARPEDPVKGLAEGPGDEGKRVWRGKGLSTWH